MEQQTKALNTLKKFWGYHSFRTPQDQIIQSVLDGKDTLALMPTGGGKSICFQVPALCQEGICIVISPLIALMKDQVQNLQKRNISAAAIYSGMHYKDIDRTLDNCIYGNIKILYLSPERLSSELAIERIKKMNVNLLAIDEAHCISQWGYDFRPSYLQIADIRQWMPNTPVLALTATATSEVVKDIQEKLEFKKGKVFQNSFTRSNLAYVVLNEENKAEKMLDILQKVKGSGIVYVRSRKKTKDIAQFLLRKQISADFYHAGLSTEIRSVKQDAWVNNKIRIIVSTNAFGMGIDKPDVKIVVHMDTPNNLEAYFQEAGRAGRDGEKSYAVLLYNEADKMGLERNYKVSFPPFTEVRRVYQALSSYYQLAAGSGIGESFDFDLSDFAETYRLEVVPTFSSLKILEQSGWIVLTESIFTPSRVQFLVNKEELYDYQLRNKKFDKIIKTILRKYQGAFNSFVSINERELAKFLNLNMPDLAKALEQMKQEAIIDYQPRKDKPQIVFIQERVINENLTLDKKIYEFRKNRHHLKMKSVIAYVENALCRSQQLLQYFGEKSEKCGVCDVCLGRTKTELSKEEFAGYKTKIQELLQEQTSSLDDLVKTIGSNREHQILRAIEFLVDEGFIDTSNGKLIWKNK